MKLIVAPRNLHKDILSFARKDDFFADIQLMDKKDLEAIYYPKVLKEAIIYLMKEKSLSYEESKAYLRDLPYIEESFNKKTAFLSGLKNELTDKELIIFDKIALNKSIDQIEVIGYSKKDNELRNLIDKIAVPYSFFENNLKKTFSYRCFEKIEDEIYYALNEIASLIKKGEDINDIYIFRRNEEYDYYLNKFSYYFHFPLNIKSNDNAFSLGSSKEFLNLYKENHDYKLSLEKLKEIMKEDERYLDVESLVLDNIYEELSFKQQYDYLSHKFQEVILKNPIYKNAVNVIDQPFFGENKHVFVLGFTQGSFPLSYKNNGLLEREELTKIHILNDKDKTAVDNDLLLNLLSSNNHFYFSYSLKSNNKNYYPSPLISLLKMKKEEIGIQSEFYSEKVLGFIYTHLRDLARLYDDKKPELPAIEEVVDVDYNGYDNSFKKGVEIFNKDSHVKLSSSSGEKYIKCPFSYYASKALGIDSFESTYSTCLGNIAHAVLEHKNDPNFDFDKFYDQEVDNIAELTIKEKYLLKHALKAQIYEAYKARLKHFQYMKNPKEYCELTLFQDIGNNVTLEGRIDSLITLDNKYYICIDYKTGKTTFSDKDFDNLNLSIQLPTYLLLTKNSSEFDYLEPIGMFINNIINTEINFEKDSEDLIPDYLKLKGKSISELSSFTYIDSTIGAGKASFVKSVSLKKDGTITKGNSNSLATQKEFEEYMDKVKNIYLETADNIRKNIFDISPLVQGSSSACQYCPFKDVCYVKEWQKRFVEKEEESNE